MRWPDVVPGASALLSLALGCFVLAGWLFDVPTLTHVHTDWVSMKANAAVAFVLVGGALWWLRKPALGTWRGRNGKLCAAAVTLIGLLTLSEYLFAWNLGIDQIYFHDTLGAKGTSHPGRMSPATSLSFLLLGSALLLQDVKSHRIVCLGQYLAIAVGVIAFVPFLGYLYNDVGLTGSTASTRMAVHAAVTLICVSLGVLCLRPDHGWIAAFTSEGPGGRLARRLTVSIIATITVLGWLHFVAHRAGFFDLNTGLSLLIATCTLSVTALVVSAATSVDCAYAERMRAEQKSRDAAAVVAATNETIKHSEERFRSIIDTAMDAVVDIDAAGVITGWNAQAEAIFGWRRHETLGQTLASTIIPPTNRDAHHNGLQHFLDTGVGPMLNKRIEITALHRDGHEFPIELAITTIAVGNTHCFSAFARDITERKRAEEGMREFAAALAFANEALRDVNEELRRRNVELDEFTFIASHDLQEPLRKLISFGELLPKDLGEVLPEAAGKDLVFITDAARRMRVLVQDLLALSRAGRAAITRERVSLESCADRALLDVDVEIERTGAEITRDELPDVPGDPTLLAQLYQNLIGNALKFAEPSRRPEIHLTCERKDDEWIFGVRDNGIGIKPEYHQQIFAPFKRLHGRGEYEGTGIGLAICRKAVERHGGRIWVESEPGKGAHFKFSLNTDSESAACLRERESRPSSSSLRMIPAIKS